MDEEHELNPLTPRGEVVLELGLKMDDVGPDYDEGTLEMKQDDEWEADKLFHELEPLMEEEGLPRIHEREYNIGDNEVPVQIEEVYEKETDAICTVPAAFQRYVHTRH